MSEPITFESFEGPAKKLPTYAEYRAFKASLPPPIGDALAWVLESEGGRMLWKKGWNSARFLDENPGAR